jgi:hypothetical protein
LKPATCADEKRRKSSSAAGFGSVTVRFGRSTSANDRYSMLQNTLPQAALSAPTSP